MISILATFGLALAQEWESGSGSGSGSGGMREILCAGPDGCEGVFMNDQCICGTSIIRGSAEEFADAECTIPGSGSGGMGSVDIVDDMPPDFDGGPTVIEAVPMRRRLQEMFGSGMGSGIGSGSGSGSGGWGSGSGSGSGGGSGPEMFMAPTDVCIPGDGGFSFKVECAGFNEVRRTMFSDDACNNEMLSETYRNGECETEDHGPHQLQDWQRSSQEWSGGLAEISVVRDPNNLDNELAFCVEATGLPHGTVTLFQGQADEWTQTYQTWVGCYAEGRVIDGEYKDGCCKGLDDQPRWQTTEASFLYCGEIDPEISTSGRIQCDINAQFVDADGNWEQIGAWGFYEWETEKSNVVVNWDGAEFCGGDGQRCTTLDCPTGGLWNSDGECKCGTVLETLTERFTLPDTCADEAEPEKSFHLMDQCIKRKDIFGQSFAMKTTCSNGELIVEYHSDESCSTPAGEQVTETIMSGTCTFTNDGCSTCPQELFGGDNFDSLRLYWIADDICGEGVPTPEPTPYPTFSPTKCMSPHATSWDGHCHVAGDPHIYGFNGAYGTVLRDGDFKLYEDEGISVSFRSAIHGGYYNAAGVNAAFITGDAIGGLEIEIYARTLYNNLFPTYEVFLDGVQTTMAEMCDAVSVHACSCSFVDKAPDARWQDSSEGIIVDGDHLEKFSLHLDQETLITWWGGSMEYGWASLYVEKISGMPSGATGICTATSADSAVDPFLNPYPEYMHDCQSSPIQKYRTNYCVARRRAGENMADFLNECETNEQAKFDEATTICQPCANGQGGINSCVFDGCADSLDAAREMARSCEQVDLVRTDPVDRAASCSGDTPIYSEDLGTCVPEWQEEATTTSTADDPIITPSPTAQPTEVITPSPTAQPTESVESQLLRDLLSQQDALRQGQINGQDALLQGQNDLIQGQDDLLQEVKALKEAEEELQGAARGEGTAASVDKLTRFTSIATLGLAFLGVSVLLYKTFCMATASQQASSYPMIHPDSPGKLPSTAM